MHDGVRFERNPDFIFRKIVDEVILVPIHKDVADMDSIYTLNGVGASIWQHLENPLTRAQLEAVLLAEYDAVPDVLTADLDQFLADMMDFGALRKVA